MSTSIAVDAMGGDHAPAAVVRGAALAAADPSLRVILVGDENRIKEELRQIQRPPQMEIVSAPEVIDMHEAPAAAVRRKRNCSMAVAAGLVRDGRAQAFVSAGNSGACMACAVFYLGLLPGVDRPAIAAVLPTRSGPCTMLDSGAVVDCSPEMLLQFAIMGKAYASAMLGRPNPRVGILSIGEEDTKGNGLTKAAAALLRSSPSINFCGNIEGTALYQGEADVVVCDGFVGNVFLKASEGIGEMLVWFLRESMRRSIFTRLGALLLRPVWRSLKRFTDYAEYGGAPLLGVRGVCVIAHGRSNARAIANAIRAAGAAAASHVVDGIRVGLEESGLVNNCRAKAI